MLTGLSADGEIYVRADGARVGPDGSLVLFRRERFAEHAVINMAFAPREWRSVHRAAEDCSPPVAVEVWREMVKDV